MNKRLSALCCTIILFTNFIYAFNHPEIKWQSVVTDHFIIHFYDHTEPAVYAAWKIAEQAYESLSDLYDFSERGKINLALADYDDYSNGFANWTNESIMIWITDSRFDLRGDNTWLRNVITHELAHVITLEKRSKLQLLDWTLSVNYQSPHAAVTLTDPVATAMFWPEWFAEGIAQRESQRAGNDCWDSRRDMLLRDAALFSKPLSLMEMGHFNHNSLGNELVYNQGFSFVTFIEGKIGQQRLKEIFNDGRNTTLFAPAFSSYFRDHTGLSLDKLYDEWVDTLKAAYLHALPRDPTPFQTVWDQGFFNSMPKVSSDKRYIGWLTNDQDDFSRTDLLVAPYGRIHDYFRIPWAKLSWDFSPDNSKAYYIKSRTPDGNGSYLNDIFVMNLDDCRERRLVKSARAYDVAVSPDNRCLAWIRYRDGVFSLVKSGIDGRDQSTVIKGNIGEPLWGLSFNPHDPNLLATTRVIDGKARLCVVDIDQKTISVLTNATAQEESPFWASDGRIYYSADYGGIYNLYSIAPDGSDCMRLTNASGGLFFPHKVDDATLLCTEYRNKGFRVVSVGGLREEPYDLPDSSGCVFKPLPAPRGRVTIRMSPYAPTLLRPVWELQTGVSVIDRYGKLETMQNKAAFRNFQDSMSYEITVGLIQSRSDALEKTSRWMGLVGAVEIEGDTATYDAHEHRFALRSDVGIHPRRLLENVGNKNLNGGNHSLTLDAVTSMIRPYFQYQGSKAASSDSSKSSSVVPLLIPGAGWLNAEHTVTLGINVQGVIVNNIVPTIIAVNGTAQWQLLRDLYADFSPKLQFYPKTLFTGQFISMSDFPLSVAWQTSGYVNTDIQYNSSDLGLLQGTISPSFFPIGTRISPDSVVYSNGSAMTYALQGIRGFPVTRYSSIVLGAVGLITNFSEPINDPLDTLKSPSSLYTSLNVSTRFVFPIVRNINRGEKYYAEALYGSLIYEMSFYSNTEVTDNSFIYSLTRRSFDPTHYLVEHDIGLGINFGSTKSYSFFGMSSLKLLWDIWGKRLRFVLAIQ